MAKYVFIIMTVFFTTSVGASETPNAKILQLDISKNLGEFVFVKLDTLPAQVEDCATNAYWQYTLPLTSAIDEKMYAMLLAAFASNSTVHLFGEGSCNEYGAVESFRGVRVIK